MATSRGTTFPSLPLEVQEFVLSQALKQLDIKHQFGTVPCVNQHWCSYARRTCRTLNLKLHDQEGADSFTAWLKKNRGVLLDLDLQYDGKGAGSSRALQAADLAQEIFNNMQLHSLALRSIPLPLLAQNLPINSSYIRDPVAKLPNLGSLTQLQLEQCNFQVERLSLLCHLSCLRSLQLRNTCTSAASLPDFVTPLNSISTSLTQLTSLELSNSTHIYPLEPAFPTSLSKLQHLQQLNLEGLIILPEELHHVIQLPLQSACFRLWDGLVSAANFQAWAHQQQLLGQCVLQQLSLRSATAEPILPGSMAGQYISTLAFSCSSLHSLYIHRCDLTESGLPLAALTSLTLLQLGDCVLGQECFAAIASMVTLQQLILQDNTAAEQDVFGSMAASRIKTLHLSGELLAVENLPVIGSMQHLSELELCGNVSGDTLSCFTGLTQLTSLVITQLQLGSIAKTAPALAALSKLAALESLAFEEQDVPFGYEDVTALTNLKCLTRLWFTVSGSKRSSELMSKVSGICRDTPFKVLEGISIHHSHENLH